jgi:hypothetical protein
MSDKDRAGQLLASSTNRATLCSVLAQREKQLKALQAQLAAAMEQADITRNVSLEDKLKIAEQIADQCKEWIRSIDGSDLQNQ